jgi:hypothetical protein
MMLKTNNDCLEKVTTSTNRASSVKTNERKELSG